MNTGTLDDDAFEKEIRSSLNGARTVWKLARKGFLNGRAKKLGLEVSELQRRIRDAALENLINREKVMHYHSTSLQAFESICHHRALLSHEKIRERDPEARIPTGSTSTKVMLTHDTYRESGELQLGIWSDTYGASSAQVTFVLGPSIMWQDDYDPIDTYPVMEEINLEQHCACVLVREPSDIPKVRQIVQANDLEISVFSQNVWIRNRQSK